MAPLSLHCARTPILNSAQEQPLSLPHWPQECPLRGRGEAANSSNMSAASGILQILLFTPLTSSPPSVGL